MHDPSLIPSLTDGNCAMYWLRRAPRCSRVRGYLRPVYTCGLRAPLASSNPIPVCFAS
jgi:hypothetical protein